MAHDGSCCSACGFAERVARGEVAPHVGGDPVRAALDADGRPVGLSLVVVGKGSAAPFRVALDRAVFVVGRAASADLALQSAALSRRTCAFVCDGGGVLVRDERSSCGTYVNGRKIGAPTPLRHGDVVYVADFTLRVAVD